MTHGDFTWIDKRKAVGKSAPNGSPCPSCGERWLLTCDSRFDYHRNTRRRRYVCLKCDERFTTHEVFPVVDKSIPAGIAHFFGLTEATA